MPCSPVEFQNETCNLLINSLLLSQRFFFILPTISVQIAYEAKKLISRKNLLSRTLIVTQVC